MVTKLSDRVALVTGAGQGIGFGIAERLAQDGAIVTIGELDDERGQKAATRLAEKGYTVDALQLDVSDRASCQRVVADIIAKRGRLDILVNNAGVARLNRSETMPEADWRLQIDVMLTGVFFACQAAGQAMIESGGGAIVSVASIGGMGGWPMRSAYNAAKAGVINLTEVLATEWAHFGIRVNCVSPGVTRTEMMEVAVRQGLASLRAYEARTPIGRVAEVSEIAAVVAFLASDRASYVTGQNLRVDGGWVPWGNPLATGYPEPAVHG